MKCVVKYFTFLKSRLVFFKDLCDLSNDKRKNSMTFHKSSNEMFFLMTL